MPTGTPPGSRRESTTSQRRLERREAPFGIRFKRCHLRTQLRNVIANYWRVNRLDNITVRNIQHVNGHLCKVGAAVREAGNNAAALVVAAGLKIDLKTEESRYMGVLVSERERCERLYYDNPKDWDERKYANRLKKQRQWIESKATKVAEKLKEKEEKSQNRFNKNANKK